MFLLFYGFPYSCFGCWLFVIGYSLLVIRYWLFVIGYSLLVIRYWLFVIGYWLFQCTSPSVYFNLYFIIRFLLIDYNLRPHVSRFSFWYTRIVSVIVLTFFALPEYQYQKIEGNYLIPAITANIMSSLC